MESDSSVMTPHLYQGVWVLKDEHAQIWMTQQNMAQLLNLTLSGITKILGRAFKTKRLPVEMLQEHRLKSSDGKYYLVKIYPLEVFNYVSFRSNKNFRDTKGEVEFFHPLIYKHLTELFAEVRHHIPMPINGVADFMCTGDDLWICEVKTTPFKTRDLEQVLDYCHQWEFTHKVKPKPLLLYVNCEAKIHQDYCQFLGVNANSLYLSPSI